MKTNYCFRAAVCLLVLFLLAAALVLNGGLSGLEDAVYCALSAWASPAVTGVLRAVTALCNPSTVVVICLVLLAVPRSRKTVAPLLVGAAAISGAIGQLLKRVVVRPRPSHPHLVEAGGYSFPSGHSLASAAICLTALLLVRHLLPPGRGRSLLTALFAALPVLIGFSRIYLGVHYAGDVLGGWLLGCATAFAVYGCWQRYKNRRQETKP